MNEIWRPVVGYEGWYEVSDLGQVRRVRAAKGAHVGRILKPRIHKKRGYAAVFLSRNNRRVTVDVHWLVAESFIGLRLHDYEIHHRDHNKLNNRADNLEYLTAHEHRSFTHLSEKFRGVSHYRALLDVATVELIRKTFPDPSCTVGATAFARKIGVSLGAVTGVITYKNWRHT